MKEKPLSIENRWDILYRDFPEVYDEFAAVPKDPQPLDILMDRFSFQGKLVADIGSGSGLSSFEFARVARKVIGVEVEGSMREIAERERVLRGIDNVEFINGDAQNIPLADDFVDIVTGITLSLYPVEEYRDFVREAQRVTSNQGWILMIDITPGWYGGELANLLHDENWFEARQDDILVNECGFSYEDFETNQEYGSLDKIIRTYGFIFGEKVIEYLRVHRKTNIKWKFRIHYKRVEK